MNGYMTTKEAAEKWGITQRQVQNHCKKNRIPGVVMHGTTYMIPEDAGRPVYGYFSIQPVEKNVDN
jgi:excisionase family DNA binding protein